ncbi:Centromere/kinetochore protein zw10 homolog [Striga hermonthica]|uniref:Centromere/kinetochore protein zw10 homolog n=1 Tax=Striga hermonthica TaxID=68872 RepID=A0A9N7MZP8_STRHE|nr:Centromere/kinetochore protein zw10 homolog [Striga hermonthica]
MMEMRAARMVQAADSLLKLVSELKQTAIFSGFASLDDHVDRRTHEFNNLAEITNGKLSRIGEEVAASLKELESHYYSSALRAKNIQELLLRFMEKAVKIEQGGNALHIKHQISVNGIDGLELYTVLKALDVAGILDYGLAKVADWIIKYVLTPLVSATPYIEEINQDSGHAPEAVFKMVPSVDPAVVPADASKLAEFQEVRKLTIDFETALKGLGFISPSGIKDEKLSRFADNVEIHVASRKKVQILSKARNMLLQSNFSLPQDFIMKISGVHKEQHARDIFNHAVLLFSSEKCVVSEAAKQLMELVHQTLKLQRQLDSINQAAVLIHNDCLYLSQEILGLHLRFQLMAEDVLKRQIQLVLQNLIQAIDGADGFQNTHQIKQFESAKFFIDQVAFIIEKMHIIWEPLLLPSIYEKSMAMILESVFSRIVKEILLLDDMVAEETLQVIADATTALLVVGCFQDVAGMTNITGAKRFATSTSRARHQGCRGP